MLTPLLTPVLRRRLVLLLTLVVLAGSGLILWLALTKPDGTPSQPAPAATDTLDGVAGQAVDAATRALPLALTYDYRDLSKSLRAATAAMTEEFAKEFRVTFLSTAAPLARDKQAVTDARVRAAGIVRVDADQEHALCLVYVDQLLVSSETMKRKQDPINVSQNRVLVELVLSDGAWLVDGIQPQ